MPLAAGAAAPAAAPAVNSHTYINGTRSRVRRLNDGALIRPHMDARMGGNINGPCALRVPDWVSAPLGRYYLYFADHCGSYIRLAYADRPEGPWQIHTPGCLDLADSRFCTAAPNPASAPSYWDGEGEGWRAFLYPHIASPDVQVDEARGEIRMYYHGLEVDGDQPTRLAISRDGLHFRACEPLLAPPYLRVVQRADGWYGIAYPNRLWRSPDGIQPFEAGPEVLPDNTRHAALLADGDRLYLAWTQVGDAPERIYAGWLEMRGDWRDWRLQGSEEWLRPELGWEGADEPVEASRLGATEGPVNQLRDPYLFRDGQRLLLYYAAAGEHGIGLAEVRGWSVS